MKKEWKKIIIQTTFAGMLYFIILVFLRILNALSRSSFYDLRRLHCALGGRCVDS